MDDSSIVVAHFVASASVMFVGMVAEALPEEAVETYVDQMQATLEAKKQDLQDCTDLEYATTEILTTILVASLGFLANSNIRVTNALISLLTEQLETRHQIVVDSSVLEDLERRVGPKTTANIINWFSSYGKDLSTMARPLGATLN